MNINDINNNNNNKQKRRKTVFETIPNHKNLFEAIGQSITKKEITLTKAFKLLKQQYKEELKDVKTSNALRNYLYSRKYIGSEESYKKYLENVSKTDFAKAKRKVINKFVIEDLLNDHIDDLIEVLLSNKNFIIKIKEKIK